MSDQKLNELDEKLQALGKRRNEIRAKQDETETEYQSLLEKMGNALLDGEGSSKVIDAFKRDVSSTEAVRNALAVALAQVETLVEDISKKIVNRKRELAEAEILSIASDIRADEQGIIQRIYVLSGEIESLGKNYRKVKDLSGPLGIWVGALLDEDTNAAVEACKWLMSLQLSHRLNVLERHYPMIAAEAKDK